MDCTKTRITPETLRSHGFRLWPLLNGHNLYIRQGIAVTCILGDWYYGAELHDEAHYQSIQVEYIEDIP